MTISSETTTFGKRTFAVLGLWFAAALAASLMGVFEVDPARTNLALFAAIGLPVATFAAGYAASPRFRAFVLAQDLGLITLLHSWRVVGFSFLVLYAYDILPGLFAFPAGLGDLVLAVTAPFLAYALISGAPLSRRHFVAWNLFGLVDFVVAVTMGALTMASPLGLLAGTVPADPMAAFPLSLIPGFFVPFFTLLHLVALIQARQAREAAPGLAPKGKGALATVAR